MPKVAIIADSIACLTKEIVAQYGITILPLNFYFGGKVYRDWVDITPSEAYQLFLKDPESFKSAPPTVAECLETYRAASKLSSNIFCVILSTKISTTYNMALAAKKQMMAENPQLQIEVMDSLNVATAEGLVVLAAARTAAEGKSLPEIKKEAEKIRDKVHFVVYLDTIRHVYRSGRIPKVASQAGSVLNIKPVLTTSSGALHFAGVARSKKAGTEQLLRRMHEKVGGKRVHVAVAHSYALEDAEALKEKLSNKFDCAEIWIGEFSPLMGYATGTGTLGIGFYAED